MLLTEVEASKADCPMQSNPEANVKCTAGGKVFKHPCPCWRWFDSAEQCVLAEPVDPIGWVKHTGKLTTLNLKTGKPEDELKSKWVRPNPTRRGYCGLGGKVEE